MKIIVHYPSDEKALEELAKRVAKIHAEAAMQHIEKLPCSKEQKIALIDAILLDKEQE